MLSERLKFLCSVTKKICLKDGKLLRNGYGLGSFQQVCGKKDDSSLSSLFVPVPVKPNPDDINVGAELTGQLNKSDLLKVINKFYQRKEIKALLRENGLDSKRKYFSVPSMLTAIFSVPQTIYNTRRTSASDGIASRPKRSRSIFTSS